MKLKSWLNVALALVLLGGVFFTVPTNADAKKREEIKVEFKDAYEAQWANEFIGKMKVKNVIQGYPDGTFQPNKPVNRVEAIVMAVRLMGMEEEAKAKNESDAELLFKDAKQIEKKFPWAKGYILVALENGLFDASEDKIQPNKAASRVWVSSLLVRALDLEDEALQLMSEQPEFKDAIEISAGAIGYVNVAVDAELITGYPNGTFQPNKPVTRAEMATLLVRTNAELLENEGAVTVTGEVYGIDEIDDGFVLSIHSFAHDKVVVTLPKDLVVSYGTRFVTADQVKEGDYLTLFVQDGVVQEAVLFDEIANEELLETGVVEFKLEVEANDNKYELKYSAENGEAKVEWEVDGEEKEFTGDVVKEKMEKLLTELALTSDMTRHEVVERVLHQLKIDEDQLEEMELKVKFANGVTVKYEMEEEAPEKKEKKEAKHVESLVKEFEFELKTKEDSELKIKIEEDEDKIKVKVEDEVGSLNHNEITEQVEELIASIENLKDISQKEFKTLVFDWMVNSLKIELEMIEELEIEVELHSGEELKVKYENEEDEDEDDDDHEDEDDDEEDED